MGLAPISHQPSLAPGSTVYLAHDLGWAALSHTQPHTHAAMSARLIRLRALIVAKFATLTTFSPACPEENRPLWSAFVSARQTMKPT